MDIDQLFSIIEEKESYTEETISEMKKLIEEFPYFQTGHMLLLKAMHAAKSEKFNAQLNISGSFIPDKIRLFKFINATNVISRETKEEETKKVEKYTSELQKKIRTEKKISKSKSIDIKKDLQADKEKTVKDIKTEIKTTTPYLKKETEARKEIKFELSHIKKEPQVKIQEIRKPETKLSASEIEKKANNNSRKRHKKIVQDFFIDPTKDIIIIDETTDEFKMQQKEPAIKEKLSINKKESVVDQKIRMVEKKEQPELKKEEILQEEKPLVKDKITHFERKEIVIEQKTEPIKEEKKKVEDKKVVEEKKPFAGRKLLTYDSKIPITRKEKSGERKQSDVMNDIFSKIRAIKKEMNISSEESPETIDINSNVNKYKRNRIVEPEDIKEVEEKVPDVKIEHKEIVKEELPTSIIEKKELIKEKTEEEQVHKTEEIIVTAKDLFNQHQKKKYEKKEAKPDERTKSKIELLFDNHESPEKNVVVDEEKKTEVRKEELNEIVKKEEIKLPEKKEKTEKEETKPEIEKESAADALLKRIALKKQKKKEEEEVEKEKAKIISPVKEESIENVSKVEERKEETVEPLLIKKEEVETKIEETKEKVSKPVKSKKLIDDFISKVDSLERMADKETTLKGDISLKSHEEKEEFMTEAMADLFIQQKYYDKAINVYNKLIFKFPQKKTYFAIQIKKVESLIKNNK